MRYFEDYQIWSGNQFNFENIPKYFVDFRILSVSQLTNEFVKKKNYC